MKKYSFLIICTLLTGLLFTTCEPWIVPEAVFVNFNANGGQGDMKALRFMDGEKQSLTKNTYTRNGYIFDGWNTRSDGRGQRYTDRQIVSITKSVTLYAQWELVPDKVPDNKVHDYVDLGLPSGIKWATCNVGATTPEGYGDYFAWGETTPKNNYDWSTYKYCNGSSSTLTKYNTNSSNGTIDNKTTLDLSDDAARANWGGTWRMPTRAEQEELINNCTWTWSTRNGVRGYKVTSKTNGNSIFLPAAGYRTGTSVYTVGSFGYYWSSSLYESIPNSAYGLYFYSDNVDWNNCYSRDYGHTVRAVCGNNTAAQTFTLTFDANGGEGTMPAQTFEAGVSQALAANAFTRSGYTFTGWNTNADGSGTAYTDKQSITLSQDITLYAQWKKDIVNYTVTFNANGGTGTMAAQTFEAGVSQAIKANTFTRSGYTFTGWNTKADGSGTSYTDNQSITLSQDITLYAQWKKNIVNYTVTFNANGGTGTMAAQTFEAGVSQAITANTFIRSGYTFTGWNTNADGSGTSYTDKQSITISQNITLYAQWIQQSSVEVYVSYEANGGYGEMEVQVFKYGEKKALLPCSFGAPSNFVFNGWNTREDGTGTSYTDGQEITLTQDITLYAQWKKITYSVTFIANGGSGTMPVQIFEIGVSQTLATNKFTRSGYFFIGWNTVPDASGTSYTDGQKITLTENIILYAQWKHSRGKENGHEWVDLGLPSGIKWATCNVGAAAAVGHGDYFAWGETSPKDNYDWSTYKYCNGSEKTLTKYNTTTMYGTVVDNKTTLELSDDAARANWGGNWRMPTAVNLRELLDNCTWTRTTQNGVIGYNVTSKINGESIFLPAAGYKIGTSVERYGMVGYYWSNRLFNEGSAFTPNAHSLSVAGNMHMSTSYRYYGYTVRAVCP